MKNTLKTAALALGMACAGSGAGAAIIANLTLEGDTPALVGAAQEIIAADGTYSASLDPTFDLTQVGDFLIEVNFVREGVSFFAEELLIEDITGDDLALGAFSLGNSNNPEVLSAFESIFAELLDTDREQTQITEDLFLSLDLTELSSTEFSSDGTFDFLLTEGPLDPLGLSIVVDNLSFDASFSISTVDVAAVPLPASLPMLAFGAVGLFAMKRRREAS